MCMDGWLGWLNVGKFAEGVFCFVALLNFSTSMYHVDETMHGMHALTACIYTFVAVFGSAEVVVYKKKHAINCNYTIFFIYFIYFCFVIFLLCCFKDSDPIETFTAFFNALSSIIRNH